MQNRHIRRRTNGTIDIDNYRQEALTLRSQARTDFLKRVGRIARPLIGTAAILVAYAMFLPRDPAPPGATSMPAAAHVSLLGD